MAQQQVTRTRFGDSLRALADLADQAPSILGAIAHPTVPSRLSVQVTTSGAVAAIAQDLGAIVNLHKGEDGSFQWSLLVQEDLAVLDVFAIEHPEKELHRPVEATALLEDQIDWGITPPSVEIGEGDAA